MVDVLPTARNNPFDPPPELGRFRQDQPLRRLAYPDGHVGWLVTTDTLARTVLIDSRFSSRLELVRFPVRRPEPEGFAMGEPARSGFFLFMDPPDHTRFRRLLTRHFTMHRMRGLEPRIRRIVDDHLDAMEQAGPPADLVREFAVPIPSLAVCELLGVPYSDREQFQRHAAAPFDLDASDEQASASLKFMDLYFAELIARKQLQPADDLISALVTGGELGDDEIAGVGMLLLLGGHDTTMNMLALGTFALLQHPDQVDALRDGALSIDTATEELLRYLTISQYGLQRTALQDIELDGHLIKAGETITISLPAANRDPARFDNPDVLDLSRESSGHLAFGHGFHQCIGQHLARIEMRVAFPALFRRFPKLRLAVPPEDVPLRADMVVYGVHQLPVTW